jgi:protease I
VANEGVEQVELTEPWKAVEQAGGTPELLAPKAEPVQAFDHLDRADTFDPDHSVADADPGDYVALVLPGGVANPDQLRTDEAAGGLHPPLLRGRQAGRAPSATRRGRSSRPTWCGVDA